MKLALLFESVERFEFGGEAVELCVALEA